MKKALITGITGQDGSYLLEFLLDKGYEVHGLRRRSSSFNTQRIDHIYENLNLKEKSVFLHDADLTDASSLFRVINLVRPHEIYNLAAQSHVGLSFDCPEYTANVDGLGVLRILEAIIQTGIQETCKLYQASTSELFGNSPGPQNEMTAFNPQSPYAVSKLFAHTLVSNYRTSYNLFAVSGILFNHESPRRGPTFVSQKIVQGLCNYKLRGIGPLKLGNLESRRDWGHAREYVEMMWKMLQQEEPLDMVIATGKSYSVREFIEIVSNQLDLKLEWSGQGLSEKAHDKKGAVVIEVDQNYFRPSEVNNLLGDATLAKQIFNWEPKIGIDSLVREMISFELSKGN